MTPESGEALKDYFEIVLSNFIDEDLPLSYKFMIYLNPSHYEDEIKLGSKALISKSNLLKDFSPSNYLTI